MDKAYGKNRSEKVALLAEGVDRNLMNCPMMSSHGVALLAEGVDRNHSGPKAMRYSASRPPRGGRG